MPPLSKRQNEAILKNYHELWRGLEVVKGTAMRGAKTKFQCDAWWMPSGRALSLLATGQRVWGALLLCTYAVV